MIRITRQIDEWIYEDGGHSIQVAFWARRTAEALRFSEDESVAVYQAALLHDIGKVAVPVELLSKNGPLDDEEWQLMRLHPVVGANIVGCFPSAAQLAPWIYHHQEKFDGSGYPEGLSGERIPLAARLLTVVDAYDAMTQHRCYRRALGHGYAVRELSDKRGAHFDPIIVDTFLQVVSCTELNERSDPRGAMD